MQEVLVPNKTIYVSDEDLPLFKRAAELAGGSLSAAIGAALRRYVDAEEGRTEGFDEITVRVGVGVGRKVRFSGILLGKLGRSTSTREEEYRVYRTRSGKFAVHVSRSPEEYDSHSSGNWVRELTNWRVMLGIDESSWVFAQAESTLEVAATIEELAGKIPPELYAVVAQLADEPAVEDLDL
ncbi:EXLDI protein [Pseudonocardia humida]|uniref:EXLDI protein n=1 Tax=Pseudonocardia humida TaxID=2800819 RepID=A0ABT1A3C3_9PSEU|nr:EXLDI protein [Pseudonocardia humida]MCO1657511.1 EXLDI protein [Pseudonocardia humida]